MDGGQRTLGPRNSTSRRERLIQRGAKWLPLWRVTFLPKIRSVPKNGLVNCRTWKRAGRRSTSWLFRWRLMIHGTRANTQLPFHPMCAKRHWVAPSTTGPPMIRRPPANGLRDSAARHAMKRSALILIVCCERIPMLQQHGQLRSLIRKFAINPSMGSQRFG